MRKKSNKPPKDVWQRRATYLLYPTKEQTKVFDTWLPLHCELYNAAIEERREAYKLAGISIQYQDQQNQLPEIKEIRPELIPLGSHALQATCKRVADAYTGFFGRIKRGETPGFPRFKSRNRYKGWTWPDPAGWKLVTKEKSRKATLVISNLGEIKARGKARLPGRPVTCTITKKDDKWYASIVLDIKKPSIGEEPIRRHGSDEVAFDWGLETFLTPTSGEPVANPRFLKKELPALRKAQRELSDKKKGSKNRDKARKIVARLHERVERARKDFLHEESAKLVARASFLATEKLGTKGMVESDLTSKGLRRSILDAAPATFLSMVRYKAEEAGTGLIEIETRVAKPSQRCPECFLLCGKKPLKQREHLCPHCGWRELRDLASARVILQWAQGRRPPGWESTEDRGGKGNLSLRSEKPHAWREAPAWGSS